MPLSVKSRNEPKLVGMPLSIRGGRLRRGSAGFAQRRLADQGADRGVIERRAHELCRSLDFGFAGEGDLAESPLDVTDGLDGAFGGEQQRRGAARCDAIKEVRAWLVTTGE